MKLRYFQTYNKDGLDSLVRLQYWDKEYDCWSDVEYVRCREVDEEDYLNEEDPYKSQDKS